MEFFSKFKLPGCSRRGAGVHCWALARNQRKTVIVNVKPKLISQISQRSLSIIILSEAELFLQLIVNLKNLTISKNDTLKTWKGRFSVKSV